LKNYNSADSDGQENSERSSNRNGNKKREEGYCNKTLSEPEGGANQRGDENDQQDIRQHHIECNELSYDTSSPSGDGASDDRIADQTHADTYELKNGYTTSIQLKSSVRKRTPRHANGQLVSPVQMAALPHQVAK
jgi:hypothetical protein